MINGEIPGEANVLFGIPLMIAERSFSILKEFVEALVPELFNIRRSSHAHSRKHSYENYSIFDLDFNIVHICVLSLFFISMMY